MWLRKKTQNLPTSCTSCRFNPHYQLGRLFPESLGKGNLKYTKLKKKRKEKAEKFPTQMKRKIRNTEVQISEEEIAKLPEKEFRIMRVEMIKNLENKIEKMQKSINKDLED